jgi:alkylation response protein AidB-like acyl-CoA dehydrogenase
MGEFWVSLESARMLCESAARELDHAWHRAENLAPAERGQVAVKVATAKVATTQTSLDITSRMFDVMGARATAAKLGMDRFFRNARTHTLHDPVDYKLKELGAFAVQDVFPTPSFYS